MVADVEWYKQWFESPYYDVLYNNRNAEDAHRFIDPLLNYLRPEPGTRILDLACGTGRHSIYLASKGFDVTGLDLSRRSIKAARQYEHKGLGFYVHDFRNYFRINYYNYIFNLFTSFGYFDNEKDNNKVLRAAHQGLAENGTMVIDFMNVVKVRANLPGKKTKMIEGINFHLHKWADDRFIYKDIKFEDREIKHHFTERVQSITLADFKKYFEQTGFKLREVFGSYDLQPFNEQTSDRLILIVDK